MPPANYPSMDPIRLLAASPIRLRAEWVRTPPSSPPRPPAVQHAAHSSPPPAAGAAPGPIMGPDPTPCLSDGSPPREGDEQGYEQGCPSSGS
eukprot:gene46700-65391_t